MNLLRNPLPLVLFTYHGWNTVCMGLNSTCYTALSLQDNEPASKSASANVSLVLLTIGLPKTKAPSQFMERRFIYINSLITSGYGGCDGYFLAVHAAASASALAFSVASLPSALCETWEHLLHYLHLFYCSSSVFSSACHASL